MTTRQKPIELTNIVITRRGAALTITIVIALVTMMLAGAIIQLTLMSQRQSEVHRRQLQLLLAAQSGLDLAAYQCARQADYSGEIWLIPQTMTAGAGVSPEPLQVTIQLQPAAVPTGSVPDVNRTSNEWLVTARAEWQRSEQTPLQNTLSQQQTLTRLITRPGTVARPADHQEPPVTPFEADALHPENR